MLDTSNNRVVLKSLQEEPHKFLGQTLTFRNTAKDHFTFLFELLENKLKNLDEVSVRSEYKIATYDRYLLTSLRYHLSIHNIHQTHLDQLDMLANKYLKKWIRIPSHGCTNLALFHPHLMGLKTPSQLYLEGHAGNYLNCKAKSDPQVTFALESQLVRESQWTGKSSTIAQCSQIFEEVSNELLIPSRENCYNYEASLNNQMPKLKEAVKQQVQLIYLEKWNTKVRDLVSQGDFLQLLISEQSNVTWRSIIFGVPKGVMEFAMRASTNILATPDNLRRWKKIASDNCKMCAKPNYPPRKATLLHILNMCETFLGETERITWRHDSVLSFITLTLKENCPDHIQVYADLEGHKVNGSSIPSNIIITSSRPDLVVVDSSTQPQTVYLFELTIVFEKLGGMEAANKRKYERYTSLSSDIKEMGFSAMNIPFEVGSRGHLTLANKSRLAIMHKLCKPKTNFTQFWKKISKVSLLCSYSIYLSRNDAWTGAPLLQPV